MMLFSCKKRCYADTLIFNLSGRIICWQVIWLAGYYVEKYTWPYVTLTYYAERILGNEIGGSDDLTCTYLMITYK